MSLVPIIAGDLRELPSSLILTLLVGTTGPTLEKPIWQHLLKFKINTPSNPDISTSSSSQRGWDNDVHGSIHSFKKYLWGLPWCHSG